MTSVTAMYTDDLKPQSTSGSRQPAFDVRMGNTHVSTEIKHRGGSPRPGHPRKGRLSVMRKPSSGATSYPGGYNPNVFTITAYLPYDGGKRLKLQCSPGQTVQQVIETAIPELMATTYQVYQFPSRALLNPEKDASVLQDQEISIEPLRSSSPDDIGDDRLAVVRELLKTEDTYLENLRNIFDIYMEPLKKWGLPQAEMNTMFRSLSRLCDLLMNFFSELELSVQHWNTHTTRIGGLFKQYRSFWEMYKEYSVSYTRACKLLKDKRAMDDSFSSFLELKRGAAMHTLESLMLLPVHRIHEYHKLLVQLFKMTPKDHVDYSDLKYTVTCVSAMVQEREEHLMLTQNKANLLRVQSRFPSDNLRLQENETPERRSKSMSHAPGTPTHMAPKSRKSDMILLDSVDSGAPSARLYLTEGPVRIISGMQSHERFFFLFDDMLIIGKPIRKQKAQHKTYKRKEQLRLSEMWVTDCVDEVMECTLPPDTAFVIGWPVTNCLAAFSTPQEKVLWYNQLSKHISAQRDAVKQDTISVQVVNRTKSSQNNIPVMMHVQACETAKSVLLRAVDMFAIAVASTNCQLWVQFSKDDSASPLIGHEHPFAIQMYHNRQQLDYMGDSKPVQLQFVIKRRSAVATDLGVPRHGLKRQKFSLIRLVRKSKRTTTTNKRGMFKVPLEKIIVNEQLPEILQEMLIRLFKEAPQTLGIFRQSANYRKVKDLKEAMDNGERVDLSNVSIHVIGALLKELLRSVPGGILMSTRYTEFVATNDVKDVSTRVLHLKKVISKLPPEHQLFLRYLFPLLHHISTNEEVNCMNTINLAICFAPSLLWPDSGLDVVKNEVPPLVQFMIEHSPKIFGTELPELYKQVLLPQSPGVENMEFAFEPVLSTSSLVPTKMEDGSESSHKRTESVDSSQSEDSLYHKNSLLRAKRNGLTLSDSQLSTISQNDYEGVERPRIKRDSSVRHGHQLDVPRNKRVKKVREPKRSSSLQGPSDMSASSRQFYERKQMEARRRSIADHTQLPVKKLRAEFVPGVQTIPDSPSESQSSSQDYQHSAYMLPRAPQGSYYPDRHYPYESRHEVHRHSPQKKRRVPQHSNSFSKGTENKPTKPMASSASWYDRLLPLEPDAKIKSRSLAASLGTRHPLADDNREQEETHPRFRVGSGPIFEELPSHSSRHYVSPGASYSQQQHVASNQSVSSSRSGSSASSAAFQARQSNKPSLAHATTNSAGSQGSPDLFAQLETTPFSKMDKEFLKVAISKRFDLKEGQDAPPTKRSPTLPTTATSYYTPITEAEVVPVERPSADGLPKMERKRADSTASIVSESSFSKSHSYQSFLSSQQKKDSQMSLQQAGLDDRPESDQHLHSLPRPHTAEPVRVEKVPPAATMYPPPTATMYPPPPSGMYPPIHPQVLPVGVALEAVPDQDTSKLYPSNSGYNSDTESSPSRTLSRPGKILEVTSPNTTLRMPPRYKNRGPQYYHQTPSKQMAKVEQPVKETNIPVSTAVPVTIPQSTATAVTEPPKEEPAMQPLNREAEVTAAVMEVVKKKPARPKSGESSKIGQLVKTFSKPDLEPNLETGKVKLGLIPPRQRSKSTSEKEVMRILHKVVEEDETPVRTPEEEERAEKHKAWASSAPTTADRKKAWESLSQDKFKRAEARSRSLKHEQTPVVEKVIPKPSMTPEMKRKSATMPDYLVTGTKRMHGNVAQIRTYKVVSYSTPEPERIRRINLRTYH